MSQVEEKPQSPVLKTFQFGFAFSVLWALMAMLPDLSSDGWTLRTALSAVFFALSSGFVAGLAVGVLFVLLVPSGLPLDVAWRLQRGLLELVFSRNRALTTSVVSWGCGLGAAFLAHVLLVLPLLEQIAMDVARTKNQALISYALVLGALLPAAVLVVAVRNLVSACLRFLDARLPFLLLGARPIWVLAAFKLAVLTAIALFLYVNWESVLLSPWQTPVQLVVAALLAAVAAHFLVQALENPRCARIVLGAFLLLTLTSSVGALSLPGNDPNARSQFLKGRVSGLAFSLINEALDSDGDGFMGAFGGGDCRPDLAEVNPAAIEIPGNGIDEDCSGFDEVGEEDELAFWEFPRDDLAKAIRNGTPVILVSSDAMSGNHVGFMGYKRKTTPNLDALAKTCVRFHEAFSQGPSTRISLPSFFSARYDTQTVHEPVGKNPFPFSESNLTMAEVFRDNGYDTVAVVPKWYFTSMWKGILQGFETVDQSAIRHYSEKRGQIHNGRWVTKAGLRHLKQKRDKPLFMWVHYYDAHFPYKLPPGIKAFGKERVDRYDTKLAFWDREVKSLLDQVKKTYGKKGYILIVTSDHGSVFDERHPKFANGYDLYSATLHIPMLWCSPSLEPRDVKDVPVSLMDILPTLVNLLGLEGSFDFEGSSLLPLLQGKSLAWFRDRVIFHQYFLFEKTLKGKDPLYTAAIRSATRNYIWDRQTDRRELYDYQNDAFETRDLVDKEPGVASRLHARLQKWLHRVHRKYNPSVRKTDLETEEILGPVPGSEQE